MTTSKLRIQWVVDITERIITNLEENNNNEAGKDKRMETAEESKSDIRVDRERFNIHLMLSGT